MHRQITAGSNADLLYTRIGKIWAIGGGNWPDLKLHGRGMGLWAQQERSERVV